MKLCGSTACMNVIDFERTITKLKIIPINWHNYFQKDINTVNSRITCDKLRI